MTAGQPDNINLPESGTSQHATPERGKSEQKVSWLELFFDLIFVVAFDQLAKRLGDTPTWENIGEFTLMFVAVWWAWAGNTVFAARFGNDSRAYRWGTLTQLVSLSVIALTLRGDTSDTGLAFALAFGVNRLIQLAQYLWITRERPDTAAFAGIMARSFACSSAVWMGSALLPGGSGLQFAAWGLALGIELLTPLLVRQHATVALPHEEHLPERVGLLQIIALGAIITEIVNGSRQQTLSWATLSPALSGIVATVALWQLYFDQARALPLLRAHVEGQVGRMLAWLYGHLPFTFTVVMVGVGVGHGISAVDAKKDALNQQFVVWPLAGALLTLAFLRWNSLRTVGRPRLDRSLCALGGGALLSMALAFVDFDTAGLHLAVAALTVLLAVVVSTDPATKRLGRLEERVNEQIDEVGADALPSLKQAAREVGLDEGGRQPN